jgi:SAM-dependent methyltransferase
MLKRKQDAFGRELLDHYEGRGSCEIVERDDGCIEDSWTTRRYFSDYSAWSPREKQALRHVRGRVLDIGAGAGRYSLHLQKKGFRVLAVDVSPLAVKVCRLRGVKQARVVPIEKLDARLGRFDTIVMMGNNFGLFGSPVKARRLLKRLRTFTQPGALILAECLDPYGTKDPDHLAYHRFNRRRGRMPGQLRLRVRYKTLATPWFDYLFVSRAEMKRIIAGTGWRIRRFLPPKGPRYVALIERE